MGIFSTFSILAIGISTMISPSPSASLSANSYVKPVSPKLIFPSKTESIPSPRPNLAEKYVRPKVEFVYAFTPATPAPTSLNDSQINFLGNCESGMTASRNSGNGFYGAFQFSPGTWNSMGTGFARADQAPLDVQKDAVERLVARSNIYSQFPGCSVQMRSRGIL